MSFGQDNVWKNPLNDAMRRGGRRPDTNSIGLYRKIQLDPSPWEKLDPLEMLDRPSPWNIGKL